MVTKSFISQLYLFSVPTETNNDFLKENMLQAIKNIITTNAFQTNSLISTRLVVLQYKTTEMATTAYHMAREAGGDLLWGNISVMYPGSLNGSTQILTSSNTDADLNHLGFQAQEGGNIKGTALYMASFSLASPLSMQASAPLRHHKMLYGTFTMAISWAAHTRLVLWKSRIINWGEESTIKYCYRSCPCY